MNFFERINVPKNKQKLQKEKIDIDQERRDFLKFVGKAGVAGLGAMVLGSSIVRGAEKFGVQENWRQAINNLLKRVGLIGEQEKEEQIEEEQAEEETAEQQEIFSEDLKSIAEIIDFDKSGKIVFNSHTVESIQHYWEKRYQEEAKLADSLAKGYYEMGAWKKHLEKIFSEEGVPTELIYLAIPESHWNVKAHSRVGAAGPYQFMPQTAKDYKLSIGGGIDQRRDPLLSCRACAQLLADLYRSTGDWRLALSGYNGGFIWQYLKEASRGNKKPSYDDYLNYVERHLNRIKFDYKERKATTHQVRAERGERLVRIARFYGVELGALARANNLTRQAVVAKGKAIKIPLPENPYSRKKLYQKRVNGYVENLNYPGKFFAIDRLIKNKSVVKQRDALVFKEKIISAEQAAVEEVIHHRVAKKEGLDAICRTYKTNKKKLLKDNPVLKKHAKGLPLGLELKIVKQKKGAITLENLAKSNPEVYELNPSIINPKQPLRAGMKIRIRQ